MFNEKNNYYRGVSLRVESSKNKQNKLCFFSPQKENEKFLKNIKFSHKKYKKSSNNARTEHEI